MLSSAALARLVFCLVLLLPFLLNHYFNSIVLNSVLWCDMSVTNSAWKRCSVRLDLQLFVGWRMSYLLYFCLFVHSGVQHMLCCVWFVLLIFVLPVSPGCYFRLPLRYSLTFIYHTINYLSHVNHSVPYLTTRFIIVYKLFFVVNIAEILLIWRENINQYIHVI